MKNKFTRFLCLFMVLLMLAAMFSACKNNGTEDGTGTNAPNGDDATPETDDGRVESTIDQTFGGAEVTMLLWSNAKANIFPEESTDGANEVSDEVYLRNFDLEESLDIKITVEYVDGEYAQKNTFMEAAEKSGDRGYDVICSYSLWPSLLATRGILTNLTNLSYPELEMPWWPTSLESYKQGNALYFVANNSSVEVLGSLEVCFANQNMIKDFGIEDPVTQVINGTWTLDKMLEATTYVTTDLNMPEGEIKYGLCVDDQSRLDALFYGSGVKLVEKNSKGKAEITLADKGNRDLVTSFITKLGAYAATDGFQVLKNDATLMQSEQTMFMIASMDCVGLLEDANVYYVLPAPKATELQESYHVINNNSYDVWCVPAAAEDREMSGTIIEAFAASDYNDIAPWYFEKKLKLRYSNSDEGTQVFDIIRQSVTYDFGRISAETLGILETPFRSCFANGYKDVYVSMLTSQVPVAELYLEELLKAYEKYEDR